MCFVGGAQSAGLTVITRLDPAIWTIGMFNIDFWSTLYIVYVFNIDQSVSWCVCVYFYIYNYKLCLCHTSISVDFDHAWHVGTGVFWYINLHPILGHWREKPSFCDNVQPPLNRIGGVSSLFLPSAKDFTWAATQIMCAYSSQKSNSIY